MNLTLNKSPSFSNTMALIDKAVELHRRQGFQSEVVRVGDHRIAYGVSSDMAGDNEWPAILEVFKATDILIIASPSWFGVRGCVCQMAMERLSRKATERTAGFHVLFIHGFLGNNRTYAHIRKIL